MDGKVNTHNVLEYATMTAPPAHRLIAVRDRLKELCGERVIAMNHAVEWPLRSPDLTPCDYFLWGHLKNNVFATPPRDLEELQGRI